LPFGFDGGDFLDLAAGRYPENPLKDCRGEILWIGLWMGRARKVVGTVALDVEGGDFMRRTGSIFAALGLLLAAACHKPELISSEQLSRPHVVSIIELSQLSKQIRE
jgi:hypothetical protein